MVSNIDPLPLNAFFQEVKEQLDIELRYLPDDDKYPIQLLHPENGLPKLKCVELLQFIKSQVDLRDNEIGKMHADKSSGKYVFDISMEAAAALADVYALSTFYPHEDEGKKS